MLTQIKKDRGLSKEEKANVIRDIVILGFAFSVFIHFLLGNVLGLGFPFNTFLLKPSHHFIDFYSTIINLYKPLATGIYYLPFTYMIIKLFSFAPQNFSLFLYTLVFVLFFCFYTWINIKGLGVDRTLTFFTFAFLTYPFLYVIDNGNTEMYVFIMLVLFFLCYQQNRKGLAGLFIAMAVAMKIYPAVFLLLYFRDRKYYNILGVIVFSLLVTLMSASQLPGGVYGSLSSLAFNYMHVGDFVNSVRVVLSNSVSLYALFRFLAYVLFWAMPKYFPVNRIMVPSSDMGFDYKIVFGSNAQSILNWLNIFYPVLVLVLFAVMMFYFFSKVKEEWKRYYLLIAATIIFPQFGFAYKLLHLFIPMYLFINGPNRGRYDLIYALSFAFLLIPKEFLVVVADVTLSIIIDPLLILFTCGLIMYEASLKEAPDVRQNVFK